MMPGTLYAQNLPMYHARRYLGSAGTSTPISQNFSEGAIPPKSP